MISRVALALALLANSCATVPAFALTPTQKLVAVLPSGWPMPPVTGPFNFLNGSLPAGITYSRTGGTSGVENSQGVISVFSLGLARIVDKGMLIEVGNSNQLLQSRTFNNASWTKTNVTAALDQTGVTGVANSASSLTATAGNGTATQARTLASGSDFFSAYIKRITGTGEIDFTLDGGTTWTPLTSSNCYASGVLTAINTNGWVRCVIGPTTITNPTVGVRLVTSGDKIAVDFAQLEQGRFSSPVITTTTVQSRGNDTTTATTSPPSPVIGNTFAVSFSILNEYVQTGYSNGGGLAASGSGSNRAQLGFTQPVSVTIGLQPSYDSVVGGVAGQKNISIPNGIIAIGNNSTVHKWAGSNIGAWSDGLEYTNYIIPIVANMTGLGIGTIQGTGAGTNCGCYIRGWAYWNVPLTAKQARGAALLLP